METRPILSIGPICVFTRVFRGSRMPCEPGGFSFELESAVQARHGHSKAKEDEDKRLWKKAWGFNLFPVFISPPGDKPCAIKNISYSHCLAAWPHLWRRLKDKMKGTKKNNKKIKCAGKGTFVYDRSSLISCMCVSWKAVLIRIFLGYAAHVNGGKETLKPKLRIWGTYSLLKRTYSYLIKNKQAS